MSERRNRRKERRKKGEGIYRKGVIRRKGEGREGKEERRKENE